MRHYLFFFLLLCLSSCVKEPEITRIESPENSIEEKQVIEVIDRIENYYGKTSVNNLRIRKYPFLTAEKITLIPLGEEVELLARSLHKSAVNGIDSQWFRINYNGIIGWSWGELIELDFEENYLKDLPIDSSIELNGYYTASSYNNSILGSMYVYIYTQESIVYLEVGEHEGENHYIIDKVQIPENQMNIENNVFIYENTKTLISSSKSSEDEKDNLSFKYSIYIDLSDYTKSKINAKLQYQSQSEGLINKPLLKADMNRIYTKFDWETLNQRKYDINFFSNRKIQYSYPITFQNSADDIYVFDKDNQEIILEEQRTPKIIDNQLLLSYQIPDSTTSFDIKLVNIGSRMLGSSMFSNQIVADFFLCNIDLSDDEYVDYFIRKNENALFQMDYEDFYNDICGIYWPNGDHSPRTINVPKKDFSWGSDYFPDGSYAIDIVDKNSIKNIDVGTEFYIREKYSGMGNINYIYKVNDKEYDIGIFGNYYGPEEVNLVKEILFENDILYGFQKNDEEYWEKMSGPGLSNKYFREKTEEREANKKQYISSFHDVDPTDQRLLDTIQDIKTILIQKKFNELSPYVSSIKGVRFGAGVSAQVLGSEISLEIIPEISNSFTDSRWKEYFNADSPNQYFEYRLFGYPESIPFNNSKLYINELKFVDIPSIANEFENSIIVEISPNDYSCLILILKYEDEKYKLLGVLSSFIEM